MALRDGGFGTRTIAQQQQKTAATAKEIRAILDKAKAGRPLTSAEIQKVNSFEQSTNASFLDSRSDTYKVLRDVKTQANKGVFSQSNYDKILRSEQQLKDPSTIPIPTIDRLSGDKGNSDTRNYERAIDQDVKKEIQGYESLLKQQQDSFTKQLTEQQAFLSTQLGTIQSQSQGQLQSYQSMLDQLTQKQATELETIRSQYAQQNAISEQTLAKLQKDIERLSNINKAPTINIDTRPAVVGQSKAQQASQARQQLGMIGTRRATPKAAEGVRTIGRLGLAIAS